MGSRIVRAVVALGLVVPSAVVLAGPPAAAAPITASHDAGVVSAALADPLGAGALTASSFPVIPSAVAECVNGIDDDEDGLIDLTPPDGETADPDCASATDNREEGDVPAACANSFDDDDDGFVDFTPPDGETADPGCASANDNNEVQGEPDPVAACSNGLDDDFDGFTDFVPPTGGTTDIGCTSAADLDEGSEGSPLLVPAPAAVVSSPLAGFPTSGSSFAILSSGDALLADDPNDSDSSGTDSGGGGGTHGFSLYDLVTLRVDLTVPAGANCLSLDFRFMSEEFPEFVGEDVNDAFVAELDTSDFTADNHTIDAPHNFAFDGAGEVIGVNTAGVSAGEADGTTYDGSTPRLRASTPVTPGAHVLYLSVFDQVDSIYDSAALLDNLRIFTAPAGACIAGTSDDLTPPNTSITAGPAGGSTTTDSTPTFTFTSTEADSTFECRVDGAAFAACPTPFTTATLSEGAHTFEVRATDGAGNTDATPASRAFTVATGVDGTAPDTAITGGPAASSTTSDSTPTFAFTSTEADSTFQCRVDAAAFAACATPFTTAALGDGSHTFRVRATDVAGNTDATPASVTFTVTTTPPVPTVPTATCDGKKATIVGTAGDDTLVGTSGNDVIAGLGGNDTINGAGGKDTICGGTGNDNVKGAGGNDVVDAGAGKDKVDAGAGKDKVIGGTGKDKLVGGGGNDVIDGGDSDDRITGDGGDDKLRGGAGDDRLDGGPGRDVGKGGGGTDVVVRCEA